MRQRKTGFDPHGGSAQHPLADDGSEIELLLLHLVQEHSDHHLGTTGEERSGATIGGLIRV